ncbi:hypothetical protein EVAR_98510_1 [Eumeta japonica]|uniref:Uncharacterized protein n=1 Tax=Eumeta variegata TaxID=151549 RepID=A0A4C2AAB9_EUMVA|nr:hypothetical protein EVAR_98510_1 [Eumeta japonica]
MEAGHIGAMTGAFNVRRLFSEMLSQTVSPSSVREKFRCIPFTPIINSISYPIPSQETGKALVISLRLPESMGGVGFKSDKVAGLSSVQSWKLVMTATLTLRSKVYAKRPSVSLSTQNIHPPRFIFGCEIKSLEKFQAPPYPD